MRETVGRSEINPVSKKPAYYIKRSFIPLQLSLLLFLFLPTGTAQASEGSVVVVDVIAPISSVTLAPGDSAPIVININVTGNQAGTATFEVYRDWTLSGGVFIGSNPEEFIVPPRAGGDPATTLYTSGTVTVDTGQGTGTFTLAASVFDITNTNTTGAKLAAGSPSNYQVTVTPPSNSPPVASGQAVTTNEDTPVDITLQATDSDGDTVNYSVVTGPSNGSLSGAIPNLTYTPAADYNGPDSFIFMANDGQADSNTATVSITVDPVNDAPSFISGGDVPVLEDSGAYSQAWATGISAGPTNESGQTLTFQVSNDNNGLFSVQPAVAANGTLTFTPAANANGTATVTVALQDNGGTANGGVDSSAPQMFDITVTAVNDAPSFTDGGDVTVLEDSGSYFEVWATNLSKGPADEIGQVLTFTTTNDNNSLFDLQPFVTSDGDLSFRPAENANGSAEVSVELKDDGGTTNGGDDTSETQTFTITVTPVNDAPVASGQAVSTNEDTAKAITLQAVDVDGDTLTYTVTGTGPSNGVLSGSAPNLTYTPNSNYFGPDSFTFKANDGQVDSNEATVSITVDPVNDAPSFTAGAVQFNVNEGASAQTVAGWASNLSAGPNESAQTLSFTVSATNTSIFSVQPAVNASSGDLTFTPSNGANGTSTVTIALTDNGGTANGGVDTSASVQVEIAVNNVSPTVEAIGVTPVDLLPLSGAATTLITATANFADPGTNDTHSATWNWGDGTPATNGAINKGSTPWTVTGSHTYASVGVYLITLTVTDDNPNQPVSIVYRYIVVYDPSAGFVTGGGWIISPAGACIWAPNAVDKAHFGFVSKYLKGATVPTGNTEFQFQAAGLNFHSTLYDWLVIAGAKAQYKGIGRIVINGSTLPDEFCFMLTAIDGQVNGGGNVDKFRIKIWNKITQEVVYDNQVGAADTSETANPVTALGGGSIVIHSPKK